MSNCENILTETRGCVNIITLNRPEVLNALNHKTMEEVGAAITSSDRDPGIDAIIITGSEKVFAAGADIKGVADKSGTGMCVSDWFSGWSIFTSVCTPIIAAVNGYTLDGDYEVAMTVGSIIAGSGAKLGQPEVDLGATPGMGGSQRPTRAIGKTKVMEVCLTGRMMGIEEAESAGLIARIVKPETLLDEAPKVAGTTTSKSLVATTQTREQINQAYGMTLSQRLLFERRTFRSLFSSNSQREGVAVFTEKREASFTNS